jgi:hypothetical protein
MSLLQCRLQRGPELRMKRGRGSVPDVRPVGAIVVDDVESVAAGQLI